MSLLLALALAASQPAVRTSPPLTSIPARSEEAKISAAIADVYAVISGPANQPVAARANGMTCATTDTGSVEEL